MNYLTISDVLRLHDAVLHTSGGYFGVRDQGLLESALAQPHMSFAGEELYPSLSEKAAALGFSLAKNHPFTDGNKRTAHASLETFLVINGFELLAHVDEQERVFLSLADGSMTRQDFTNWVTAHISPLVQ